MNAPAICATVDIATIGEALLESGFCHVDAGSILALTTTTHDDWAEFAEHWDHLEVDRYMADGGAYRRRRYSKLHLDVDGHELTVLPHGPYQQPRAINRLNGGVERYFEPCTPEFLQGPVVQNLLPMLGEAFAATRGVTRWNIRLHPYRISASAVEMGKPAPEGIHRDGVTFIMTLMVSRTGVRGGESSIHASDGEELYRATLLERGELLVADDATTLHGVTPVAPVSPQGGHRDVLVIAFTDPDDE